MSYPSPSPADVHGYWPGLRTSATGGPNQRHRRSVWRWILGGCAGCLVFVGAIFVLLVSISVVTALHNRPPSTPSRSSASSACSPAPCEEMGGLRLTVNSVDRNYQPKGIPAYLKSQAVPKPGFHFVRVVVTFTDLAGEHEVSPSAVDLKDTLGYQHGPDALFTDPDCQPISGSTLAPGGHLGPAPLCFEAGGDPAKPMTLIWIPSGLTGLQPAVEVPLP